MTTNTTTKPISIIRKTTSNVRTRWYFSTERRFVNHRLVRLGEQPYNDCEYGTQFYTTRKAALEAIDKMIANGWTLANNRMIKDTTK